MAISHGPTRSIWARTSSDSRSSGPRRASLMNRRGAGSSSREVNEHRQILGEMPRGEERPAHVLAAGRAHARDQLRVVEEMADAEGRALDGVDGVTGHVV